MIAFRLQAWGEVLGEPGWLSCGPGEQAGSDDAVDVLLLAAQLDGFDLDDPADCFRAAVAVFRGGSRPDDAVADPAG